MTYTRLGYVTSYAELSGELEAAPTHSALYQWQQRFTACITSTTVLVNMVIRVFTCISVFKCCMLITIYTDKQNCYHYSMICYFAFITNIDKVAHSSYLQYVYLHKYGHYV